MKSIIKKIDELLNEKDYVVVAIDGCAAAGKTTLAKDLQRHYNCEIIKMDHFFLPPQKRTMERLSTPGGNIDYERFKEEVIKNLGKAFFYRVFNCSKMQIDDDIFVKKTDVVIIEGSYSLHPYFGKYYDLSIFLDVDRALQIERIKKRDGEVMLKMFVDKWIKYENNYHDAFEIKSNVDIYKK